MKHTPGPWKVNRNARLPVEIYAPHRCVSVAHAYHVHGADTQEQIANARLIATAPELLEKSQNLLAWLRAFFPDEPLFSPDAQIANQGVYELEAILNGVISPHLGHSTTMYLPLDSAFAFPGRMRSQWKQRNTRAGAIRERELRN